MDAERNLQSEGKKLKATEHSDQAKEHGAQVSPQMMQDDAVKIVEGFSGYNMHELYQRGDIYGSRERKRGNERIVQATVRRGDPPQRLNQGRIENGELVGVRDGWVIFAVHPLKGRRAIKKGIVMVDDERIVCGGKHQGFFASPIPEHTKDQIRINATIPPTPGQISFPNLFMLAPTLRQMAQDVVEVAQAGDGEITHPLEIPRDEFVVPGVDSRLVGRIYKAAKASAKLGEEPQLPELPAVDTLSPGVDARALEQVYRNVMAKVVKDAAIETGQAKSINPGMLNHSAQSDVKEN